MKSTNKSTIKNAFKAFGNLNRARSAKVPLLIVALAAAIVFSMVACDDGVGGPGGGGGGGYNPGGNTPSNTAGTLTITGIPRPSGSDNEWFVYVYPSGTPLSTWDELDYVINNPNFEAANVYNTRTGPTFRLGIPGDNGRTWTGSGSRPVLLLDSGYNSTGFFSATVNFSNGSATVPWSSFRAIRYH